MLNRIQQALSHCSLVRSIHSDHECLFLFFKILDATDDASIQQAVEKVQQRLNGKDLNCLINNAGVAAKLRLSNINEKDMMEAYGQNLVGAWKVTKVEDIRFFLSFEKVYFRLSYRCWKKLLYN